jgi:dolichol-phosphate mannosyltransferase
MQPFITVISPVYKAEFIIEELVRRNKLVLSKISEKFEIILIDDCYDNSWAKICEESAKDPRVVGIKLSKNFGQHHAITAGLDYAKGEWIVVMDCDLQDQPEEIVSLYNKAKEGYDIVLAQRVQRQDTLRKRMGSKLFYSLFSYLSGIKQDGSVANFGIYHAKVIRAITQLREPMRAFAPMVHWVGFKKTYIEVEHAKRFEGKSSYSWNKLLNLALDIAVAYSDKPLKITIKLGVIISSLAVLFTIYNLIAYKLGIIRLTGYASLIISIWFLCGLIIFTLGIFGLYISKIFEGTKNRPLYIVDKIANETSIK